MHYEMLHVQSLFRDVITVWFLIIYHFYDAKLSNTYNNESRCFVENRLTISLTHFNYKL